MYCKTLRDEESLAAAYRAGFEGADNEALIDGVMLHKTAGIWQPVQPARRRALERKVVQGRLLLEKDDRMKDRFASNVMWTD